MKKFKENKAITLIALVITIIILLILAGISIAQLTGNGLFEKAKLAKEVSKNAQENEEDKIKQYGNEIYNYVNSNRDTVTISKEEYEILKNNSEYSNEEKIVGKWINGDTMYQKSIIIPGTNFTANAVIDTLENGNYKEICKVDGHIVSNDNSICYQFPEVAPAGSFGIKPDGKKLTIVGSDLEWANYKQIVLHIKYTKQ